MVVRWLRNPQNFVDQIFQVIWEQMIGVDSDVFDSAGNDARSSVTMEMDASVALAIPTSKREVAQYHTSPVDRKAQVIANVDKQVVHFLQLAQRPIMIATDQCLRTIQPADQLWGEIDLPHRNVSEDEHMVIGMNYEIPISDDLLVHLLDVVFVYRVSFGIVGLARYVLPTRVGAIQRNHFVVEVDIRANVMPAVLAVLLFIHLVFYTMVA
jgi:hypothetical protein